jgi:glycosyltransferase involved in cell wall biosynthesis
VQLAIVHDWLNQIGGAEDVLQTLAEMFPQAPIYTSMYWPERMPEAYRTWDIRTTWLDLLPGIHRHHQPYLPLYPFAFGQLDLSGFDVVLSNKSGFCHGVRAGKAVHICYCLTPTRYIWDFEDYAAREAFPKPLKIALRPLVAALRRWDFHAGQRVTHFVAISDEVQGRIRRYYRRDSTVIHPPVRTPAISLPTGSSPAATTSGDGFYLIVSRLIPYRRIDLAVRAFNQIGLPLVIAGDGRDRSRLEAMARPNVTFLGRVPDTDLPGLFAGCRAYVVPGTEDFGIAPVQAQAAGRPVIAYGAGGALDTVIEGRTGVFFHEQTPEALAASVLAFDPDAIDPSACRANAERFSVRAFKGKLSRFIETAVRQASETSDWRKGEARLTPTVPVQNQPCLGRDEVRTVDVGPGICRRTCQWN